MSYLTKIKEQVSEAKLAEVQSFEQYMGDYCVNQFKDSLPNPTAVVYPKNLTEEGISVEGFTSWLEGEGFSVRTTTINGGVITISYLNKE